MKKNHPWPLLFIGIALVASSVTHAQTEPPPIERAIDHVPVQSVRLWEGPAPEAKGDADSDRPQLGIFLAPRERATGAAVIVCPGGGYWIRAMDHEGLQVAQWLNARGIHAFVLSYRVRSTGYERETALTDAARAMRVVRARANEFGVDPARIGMLGFSAGAHLISWMADKADAGHDAADDEIERASSRPDFLICIYGQHAAQASELNAEVKPVRPDTPPTFVVLTHTDFVPPQSMMRQVLALREAGVEAELHLFGGDGAHGRGLHTGDPDTGVWRDLAINWLRRNKFLTAKPRSSVEGRVTIDGVPPFMGWITLIPVDDPNAPAASVHISDADRKNPANGNFTILEKYGPVSGRYRLEVRHHAKDLLPVPTMPGERLYTKLAPDDVGPLIVTIKPGTNRLELPIRSH